MMVMKNITREVSIYMMLVFFATSLQVSNGGEIDHLLSFKASLKDPTHCLSNWNNSTLLCTWTGITCSLTKTHITQIDLSNKNLSGELSPSLFFLSYIDSIDLSGNTLSGSIPENVFSSLFLRSLNLSNNNFTGLIPKSIPKLGLALEVLDLSNNMISGSIPEAIGLFSNMRYLDFGGNTLVGEIPSSILNLTGLEYLTLSSNQLSGEIPSGLGNLSKLKWVYLGYNKLSGKIPSDIGMLTSLNHLDLVYNNLIGPIPSSFGNLTNLQYLFLYQNKLTGSIPPSIFSLQNLISLDLSDNSLSGEIPEQVAHLKKLQILHLFSNNLTGKIPSSLSSLPSLRVLQLWANNLVGEIPRELGKQNNLTILDLSTNSLSGNIPNSLCNSGYLFKLILFSNSLDGEIPSSLGNCNSLKRIRLQNNSLSGGLPKGFTKLKNVYFLDLSGNNLSGKLEDDDGGGFWEMPALQMLNLAKNKFVGNLPDLSTSVLLENLDLSKNNFSGMIPKSYGKLSHLMDLKLGRNGISGSIPEELASCNKLVSLDLSHNQLTGPIPQELGQMPVLGQLDLSDNQLTGEIPSNLGAVDSLVEVNISYNHFHGGLPSTGAFLAINPSAVAGNHLCSGDHSMSGLPPCRGQERSPTTTIAMIFGATIALVMVVFMVIFIFIRRRSRRRRLLKVQRVEVEQVIWEVQFFDPKASNLISNIRDMLKHPTTPTKNNNIANVPYVVEHLNGFLKLDDNLWEEITSQYGRIRHPNIVKLVGACRSGKEGLLIYENIQGKSLSQILHGLSWVSRRRIALGIARALKFLHYHCIFVGEVSPENVIIGEEDDEARLRMGVVSLCCLGPKSFLSSAYIAPETKEAKEITDRNDVYGFGLLLIELLTGRGPTDPELGAHQGIIGWARYCYSDCHLDTWIDPEIRDQIKMKNQNEIVEILNLALQCTATDPTARPCSSDVVKTLESVGRSKSCVSGFEISSR